MNDELIIVTGASGKLGSRIIAELLNQLPADRIVASTRDPGKLDDIKCRGVQVRQGDFTDRKSLEAAFAGVSQLLMVSSNAQAHGGNAIAQHGVAIDVARAAGVRRIVYTSHMGASAISAFSPMHAHAATESMLRESGIAWTALRNGFYAETLPMVIGDAAVSGVITTPPDGKVAWTTHDDLAKAAAYVLTHEGSFEGPTPPLTASATADFTDVAGTLSGLYGRQIRHRIISEAENAAILAQKGVPLGAVGIMLAMYRAANDGEFSAVDPTLGKILGRPPTSVQDFLAERI